MQNPASVFLGIMLLSGPACAAVLTVAPDGTGDFPTIQAAIDAAADGDIIELAQGVFAGDGNRDLDFLGKAIKLRSHDGDPASCVIDCGGTATEAHRGIYFHSGEGPDTIVEGVTITGGHVTQSGINASGGAILCDSASPTVTGCRIISNRAGDAGGAMRLKRSSMLVEHCDFVENRATWTGGCVWTSSSSPVFNDCTFSGNRTSGYHGLGGGVYCAFSSPAFTSCVFSDNSCVGGDLNRGGGLFLYGSSTATVVECTFSGNETVVGGGGLECQTDCLASLLRCTFYGNSAAAGGGVDLRLRSTAWLENCLVAFGAAGEAVWCSADSDANLVCCDVFGNTGGDWVGCVAGQCGTNGNISADPLFCDAENGDFTIAEQSPCSPAGNPECGLIGAWPVGCEVTPVRPTSWASIKALFRR